MLGEGAYGTVTIRDNQAIKKFSRLRHLIQEYTALQYLHDCRYIVHATTVNYDNLEIGMELYDCSMRDWMSRYARRLTRKDYMPVIRDILRGMIELHDRRLAHGDLKPGNILLKLNGIVPLKVVLGDCGFVSIDRYCKVERTAKVYRDPNIEYSWRHDMYSLGIIMLEVLGNEDVRHQMSYNMLKQLISTKIEPYSMRSLIRSLVNPNKSRRPTARTVIEILFREDPPNWIPYKDRSLLTQIQPNHHELEYIKHNCLLFDVNRGKKGYGALCYYKYLNHIDPVEQHLYLVVLLLVLSANFGGKFKERRVEMTVGHIHSRQQQLKVIRALLSDITFVRLLLSP